MASTKESAEVVSSTRSGALQAAFRRSIRNILRAITIQSISEAFPYADPAIVETLVEQTKSLFTHYAHDRWDSLARERSILELCDQFDQLEAAALKHLNAGLAPHHLPRDPQLSIPPLIIDLIRPLLKHYERVVEDQRLKNEALHAHILKQATEVDRLEKEICDRMDDVKLSIEKLDQVIT